MKQCPDPKPRKGSPCPVCGARWICIRDSLLRKQQEERNKKRKEKRNVSHQTR